MSKKAVPPKKGRRAPKRAEEPRVKAVSESRVSVSEMRLLDAIMWDEGNIGHLQKHGVRLGAVEAALLSTNRLIFVSPVPSAEQRFIVLARVDAGLLLRVIVTPRNAMIRPVSAGVMTTAEASVFKDWESRTKSKKSRVADEK